MIKALNTTLLLALATAVGAYGAPERTDGPTLGPQNDQQIAVADTIEQDIQHFRTQVEEAIRESEQALERAAPRIQAETEDAWQELSTRAETTWEGLRTEVQGLIAEDNGRELDRSREQAATQLAELHGEVIQHELRASSDMRDFQQSAMRHLRSIEEDLNALQNGHDPDADVMDRDVTDQQREEMERARENHEQVERLREELNEVRSDLQELSMVEEEEFMDQRDEAAEQIGELAREVRAYKYQKVWTEDENR